MGAECDICRKKGGIMVVSCLAALGGGGLSCWGANSTEPTDPVPPPLMSSNLPNAEAVQMQQRLPSRLPRQATHLCQIGPRFPYVPFLP
jgi:hypothetical protein